MPVAIDGVLKRRRLRVHGTVQGVGFRPFVYRLANRYALSGFVNNDSRGVCIEVEGALDEIDQFCYALAAQAPPLSRIARIVSEDIRPIRESGFRIETTRKQESASTHIARDVAVCEDCLTELFDPADRRYQYPFLNCTNCGPRYTIVHRIPYDRPNTSMNVFGMCERCAAEYRDPADRRFHAQPNACPDCGPRVTLCSLDGSLLDIPDPIAYAADLLRAGKIVAIRGLGGFHLAVDALNEDAVRQLRARKGRAEKPFAMMAPDLPTIRRYCEFEKTEADVLTAPSRPIVLLRRREEIDVIAPSVAPRQRYLGFMLPYTPLHHLLLRDRFEALVMTSANLSEEPIAISNSEAFERLAGIADHFLVHDREILQRCDDSVARVVRGRTRLQRRSRGFVPASVGLPVHCSRPVLAAGGELKNTIAMARDRDVFLSQHIGDLDNPEAFRFFESSVRHLGEILEIQPEVVAFDLHPEYLSTKWALQSGLPHFAVQHHHAHLAAVMAENGVTAPTIGIILDGTGYGTDGTIWGGEVLVGDLSRFERFAWLEPLPLPGGEIAIRHPWRLAVAAVYRALGAEGLGLPLPLFADLPERDVRLVATMIDRNINSPLCSSAGRLFDAVSALCNLRTSVTYEAQAAIELEMVATGPADDTYPVDLPTSSGPIRTDPLIHEVVSDVVHGVSNGLISSRFHTALAQSFAAAARAARDQTGIHVVGLSGGVFQNAILLGRLIDRLESDGFEVLTHTQVPTNDGGLSYGQAAVVSNLITD
jgi:hydrogenase maturation protein HypF